MPDRRKEIVSSIQTKYFNMGADSISEEGIFEAMDEYMKKSCLELIQWMLNMGLFASRIVDGQKRLYYRGEYITPEQLFENFL